ncbi:hypothetical protein, conserved [Leishmania tarentolae]|uniref:Uncharacterized protein n=1 Tax=Leishmania tarentolae TaxID=5689 RepID=A0A640K9L2_LEITA|nr:hypothetical protein, conserved [Leishmania tarentolae]
MAEVRQQKSNRAVSEVVEYLQLAGQHYREHVELLRQEQAVKDAQHAPFKPHVSLYAKRVGKNSVVRQSSSIGARLHELHEKKLALLKEEAEEEAKRRATAEAQDCSFAPAVTTRAARSRRAGGDVAMALMRWGEQRRARQARAQLEATRNELSKVSAAPRITAYADEKARAERRSVSVEVSLTADAEARRQRRHAAFEKAYPIASSSSSVATSARCFSPSISAHASRIEVEEDVVSRLYERSRGSRGHVAPREGLYDEEAALHCTFHPKLSAQTAELSRRYYEEEGEADIDAHERLFRNTQHAHKYRKPAQLSVFTGHPEISDASRRIVEERRRQQALDGQPGALGLSPGSRLCPGTASVAAAQVTKTSKKALSGRDIEVQQTLTYAPSVSPASEALWRQRVSALKASGAARNTEEARRLLWRKAEKRKEEEMLRLQEERRKKEAAECTFRPKPGRPPQRSSGYVAMPIEARTALWAQQRDRRLADLRTELNDITVEECPFRPHVDPVFPLPRQDAKPAWGVEAFLERQVEARRLRKEAEQWWRPKYTRVPVAEASRVSCWRSPLHRGASRPSLPRAAGTSRRGSASNTASESDGDEGIVFEQHWARPPASTSLSTSSFSRVSQQEVSSAESSPSHVMQQHSSTRFPYEAGIAQRGPYQWRSTSAAGASEVAAEENADCAAALPPWRRPLRYRPISLTATVPRLRSVAL